MNMEDNNQKKENEVEKIVSGGATMFPRMEVRPEYPPASEILIDQIKRTIRGPGLAVIGAKLMYPLYKKVAEYFLKERKWSEPFFFASSTTAVHLAVYFLFNGIFLGFDHYKVFQEYRLARKPAQIPTSSMIKSTLIEFIAGLPFSFIGSVFLGRLYERIGAPKALDPLPSNAKMFLTFITALYVNQVGFYFVHRLVHARELYKMIHKKHHTYVGTVSIAAENASPLEQVTANLAPTLLGCIFAKAHPLVWLTWLAWRLEETLEAHSGYCFADTFLHNIGLTNSDSAAFHDHHHVENKGNFGFEFVDWMFGTMDHWVAQGRAEGYVKKAREAYQKSLKEEQQTDS